MRAFSVIEILVVVIVVSIIAGIGITKISKSVEFSSKAKIKSEVSTIRLAIYTIKQNLTLSGSSIIFDRLDDSSIDSLGELLFNGFNSVQLLKYPIISSNTSNAKSGDWVKIGNTTYRAYISKSEYVDFSFNNLKFTFDCDYSNQLCKELGQ